MSGAKLAPALEASSLHLLLAVRHPRDNGRALSGFQLTSPSELVQKVNQLLSLVMLPRPKDVAKSNTQLFDFCGCHTVSAPRA